jgi:hypothetical protein
LPQSSGGQLESTDVSTSTRSPTWSPGRGAIGVIARGQPWEQLSAAHSNPHAISRESVTHYDAITARYRSLYWTDWAPQLFRPITEHAQLGIQLLRASASSAPRESLAASVAEAALLGGRLAFFDMRSSRVAQQYYKIALEATKEARDHALGAAIFAHMSFIPAFARHPREARDLLQGARTHAAHGLSASTNAWLEAVIAEVAAYARDYNLSLSALGRSEDALAMADADEDPPWMDWFSYARFEGFKGYCLLRADKPQEALQALHTTLASLPPYAGKQQAVTTADLADAHLELGDIHGASDLLSQAAALLSETSYATGWERVHDVRARLTPWEQEQPVRDLDDILHGWRAPTVG